MANTGDGFWRWAWQTYDENVQYGADAVIHYFEAKWYRAAILGAFEAIAFAGLWWAGAL